MIAIGIGCRRGASAQAILDVIALARAKMATATGEILLCSGDLKSAEAGLKAAADRLAAELQFLPMAALRAVDSLCVTRSQASIAATGLGSMAEAAALAAAGPNATLIVPRLVGDGVTCAVALSHSFNSTAEKRRI